METYYTVYKITNQINGKIYIGCHKTKNLNDGYMGSGKYLNYSLKKHGIENFTKEIIATFDNSDEMFALEAKIVTEEFIAEKNTYNLKLGGNGGWDFNNNSSESIKKRTKPWQESGTKAAKEKFHSNRKYREKHLSHLRTISEQGRAVLSKKYGKGNGTFKGKVHSEKSKKKIGKANAEKQKGKGNSQYGTIWIYNLEAKKSKKIMKEQPIPDGWLKGRKLKF